MKIKITYLMLLAFTAFTFVSCNYNDDIPEETAPSFSYILNYGSFSGAKSTITAFNTDADTVSNNYYKARNGVDIISNVQHAIHFNENIYFMGNNTDEIFLVDDERFVQTENGISTDIVKPRFAAGFGNYLYVSCWGGDIWIDNTISYIAKVNLTTNMVEEKISLPGGPEGLAIANDKLYAALNYKDSVAVLDLTNDAISYIETPAVSSYFVKDNVGNLYVSLLNSFSKPSENDGIGYINTSSDEFEEFYALTGVSTSYVNIMAQSDDYTKLYVMTSGYDANWNISGAVAVFDTNSKTFETEMFVEGIAGLNGVAVNNDEVFCFVSESVTGNGLAKKYAADGTFIKDYQTGIAPFMLLNVE